MSLLRTLEKTYEERQRNGYFDPGHYDLLEVDVTQVDTPVTSPFLINRRFAHTAVPVPCPVPGCQCVFDTPKQQFVHTLEHAGHHITPRMLTKYMPERVSALKRKDRRARGAGAPAGADPIGVYLLLARAVLFPVRLICARMSARAQQATNRSQAETNRRPCRVLVQPTIIHFMIQSTTRCHRSLRSRSTVMKSKRPM